MNNLISKSFIILLLLTNNSFAIFSKNKLPATPVSMQIDLSKKGNKAEIDLRIETKEEKEYLEPESTAFELQFISYDPRYDNKYNFDQSKDDYQRFFEKTQEQFDKITDFANNSFIDEYKFSFFYNGLTNSWNNLGSDSNFTNYYS
jgi:hypothetical protein